MLTNTRPNLRILHPLPRVNEIAIDVDDRPEAYYFEQAKNGVYTRMGIITYLMNQLTIAMIAKKTIISKRYKKTVQSLIEFRPVKLFHVIEILGLAKGNYQNDLWCQLEKQKF